MKTVLDAVRKVDSLDNMITMLTEMEETGPMLIADVDRLTILELLEEYRDVIYEMKVAK